MGRIGDELEGSMWAIVSLLSLRAEVQNEREGEGKLLNLIFHNELWWDRRCRGRETRSNVVRCEKEKVESGNQRIENESLKRDLLAAC